MKDSTGISSIGSIRSGWNCPAISRIHTDAHSVCGRGRCLNVEQFDSEEVELDITPFVKYFSGSLVINAVEILVQEYIPGMVDYPETRAFFWAGEFLYAVANSKHRNGMVEVTAACDSASDCTGSVRPNKCWRKPPIGC